MICHIARLTRIIREGPDASVLFFELPALERKPYPGQFFMVKLLVPGFPLFGRALAVLDYQNAGKEAEVGFLVKQVGTGTEMLCQAEEGMTAMLTGPAGNFFPAPAPEAPAIFVAGGTGLAAFYYWLHGYGGIENASDRLLVLYGARNRSCLYLHETMDKLSIPYRISTDDGSMGTKGFVSDLLAEQFEKPDFSKETVVYACGPDPMMKVVAGMCGKKGVALYLSLEVRMACGIGVCNGCAVEVERNGGRRFERVCYEGPVYPAHVLPHFSDDAR
ncbi:MAG: iron-sulfur cluster-binding protein [Planctomycetota bacterium]|jgi:dihydroorotate dehydrogenase electron transfer subunit